MVNAFSLWSFQRVTRRYQFRCQRRYVYTFGPALLRSGNPFGWLVREVSLPATETLLVYPLIAPLESFGFPSRYPYGRALMQRCKSWWAMLDAMLSHAAREMEYGWASGVHEALDQFGALVGPAAAILALRGKYRLAFAMLLVPALLTV